MLKEKEKLYNNLLTVIDIILSILCFIAAYAIRHKHLKYSPEYITLAAFMVITWYILLNLTNLTTLQRTKSYSSLLFDYLLVISIGMGLLFFYIFIFKMNVSRLVIFLFAIINFTVLVLSKIILHFHLKHFRSKGYNQRTIAIIAGDNCDDFIKSIKENSSWGYKIHSIFSDSERIRKKYKGEYRILPEKTDIHLFLETETVDELVYCKTEFDTKDIQMLIYSCQEVGVTFHLLSKALTFIRSQAKLDYIGEIPFFIFRNTPSKFIALKVKQFVDILIAFFALTISSPVLLVIALIIKATSKGPVIYKQKRVGLRGREFFMYKFRTMVQNADELKEKLKDQNEMDGPVFKIKNDPRITKIGRFLRRTSLDEFPQFFNVLKGDMSIVGPRPPVPEEVKLYERWQLRRLSMKPGITCIWQVSGRNEISFEEWMKLDLQYIDSWSLKLDFMLIFRTLRVVVKGTGS